MKEVDESRNHGEAQMSGAAPEGVRTKTCVLYDETTGEIQHVHMVTTHGDMEPRGDDEVEQEAHELVERAGRTLQKVRALHLEGALRRSPGVEYKIDVRKRSLQERKVPEPGGPDRRE